MDKIQPKITEAINMKSEIDENNSIKERDVFSKFPNISKHLNSVTTKIDNIANLSNAIESNKLNNIMSKNELNELKIFLNRKYEG